MLPIISLICRILLLLEMSAVNLYNVYNVCTMRTKRVSSIIYCSLLVFTQTTAIILLINMFNNLVITSLAYTLSYFLWLIPLKRLAIDKPSRLLSMLCTTMGFTLLGTSVAMMISNLLPKDWQDCALLLVQTLIYAFFAPWYSHFCKGIFSTSRGESSNMQGTLLRLSIFWFSAVFFTYFALTTQNVYYAIFCVLSIGLMGFSCYSILHSNVRSTRKADKLTQFVYEDDLTGLANRTAFFSDGQMLIGRQSAFDVVFLDLNKFKSVNDRYGHLQGNEYLKGFAQGLLQANASIGTPYRMSGDEFVCIVKKGHGKMLNDRLDKLNWNSCIKNIMFLGVSVGYATFPEQGSTLDELVQAADKEMYKDKGKSTSRVRSNVR